MRSKPEVFEEHAARCEEMAAEAPKGELEGLYRALAHQWRNMAEQVRELRLMQGQPLTAPPGTAP